MASIYRCAKAGARAISGAAQLLMTAPGVGFSVVPTYVAAIDDPAGLLSSKSVWLVFRNDTQETSAWGD